MHRRGNASLSLLLAVFGGFIWTAEGAEVDPTRWGPDVHAYAAQDVASPAPLNAIVFTGSSSIVQWKTLEEDMAPLTVLNRAFGGSTMRDLIYWLDTVVIKYKPRAVVIYEGDNDIGSFDVTSDGLLDEFKTVVSRIQAELPGTRIYFLSIKPSISRSSVWPEMRRANELIRAYCETGKGLHFLDVASPMFDAEGGLSPDIFEEDGLHMKAAGYRIWTSVVKPILLEREGSYESAKSAK